MQHNSPIEYHSTSLISICLSVHWSVCLCVLVGQFHEVQLQFLFQRDTNFFYNFITCSVTFFSIIDFRRMESRIHFQRNYAGFRNRSWGFHLVDNILLNMLLGFFLDNLMTCIVWINIHIHFFFAQFCFESTQQF